MNLKENIKQLKDIKLKLEKDLFEAVNREISTFRKKHGITPSDIYIELLPIEEFDAVLDNIGNIKKTMVVSKVEVRFDI